MTTLSKTKSCFEQPLSEIYARCFRKNNQKVCVDCLKARSNKNKFECKNVVALNFMCLIIKILYLKYCPFAMYKMKVLSKINHHSDTVDYVIKLPFYNKPIKKPKVKRLKNID